MKKTVRRLAVLGLALALGTAGVVAGIPGIPGLAVQPAEAADASQFNAGMIITDALFYNGSAMTGDQVQAFLAAKVPNCYGAEACMPSARQSTPNMPSETGLCNGYRGAANERVSDIIAKVGASCGISQKVLLVLLQKEQSLVTASSPTQWAYDHATGYNCPDSPPGCDPAYAGFFFQVWYAARQYKYYVLHPTSFNYLAGRVNYIRWSPASDCTTTVPIYIQNNATAGLYDYTPYTPDPAALANLYGSGDHCSSYGNRNFWRIYTDWFGSTSAGAGQSAMTYAATTYASSLGTATEPLNCPISATTCSQTFQNGNLYWSAGSGVFPVLGALRTFYQSGTNVATMGYPQGAQFVTTGGLAQYFANAVLYSGPPGVFPVYGGLQTGFASLGGLDVLGWPTAENVCGLPGAGCTQAFQNGTIVYSAGYGSHVVTGTILDYFMSHGTSATLGYPVGAAVAAGGGTRQTFSGADIYAGPTGTFAVYGSFASLYAAAGGPSSPVLGWPTADNVCGLPGGGCSQTLQYGGLYLSSTTSAQTVPAPLDAAYRAAGGPTGALGYPVESAQSTPVSGGGTVQAFQKGAVYASTAGAFVVDGTFFSRYLAAGGPGGSFGWPTSADVCASDGTCRQTFQNGSLELDAIDAYSANAALSLGPPLTAESAVAGGQQRRFTHGSVYFSSAGTYGVYEAIDILYRSSGGPAGALGWPTAGDHCGLPSGGCSQSFQNGSIYFSTRGTYAVMAGDAVYRSTGGLGGSLGYPAGSQTPVVGGSSQRFDAGTIYSSAAGSFPVYGVLRTAYVAAGGPAGALQWPTADNTCGLLYGGCGQPFQGGSLYWASPYTTRTVPQVIDAFYRTAGGPNGSLGYPTEGAATLTGGSSQAFVWGTVFAGPSGTFGVYGSLRTAYLAAGGPGGSLGWPMAANTCSAGICSQQFQHGTLTR